MKPPIDGAFIEVPIPQSKTAIQDITKSSATDNDKRRPGWHYSIFGGLYVTSFSLLCNIILLIVGLVRYDGHTGRGRILSGSCANLPSVDSWFHLVINILSALMLGASNAALQVLSAPTRASLDQLHAKGMSADIGLNGFRNFKIMSPLRRTLWLILVFSSVPLHLLYNSVIVSTVTSWNWYGFLVTNDFVQGTDRTVPDWNNTATTLLNIKDEKLFTLQQHASTGQLQRMDRTQCIQAFSTTPVYEYSNVLMVVDNAPFTLPTNSGSVLALYNSGDEYDSEGLSEFYNLTWALQHTFSSVAAINSGTPPANVHQALVSGSEVQVLPESWPLFWNNTPLQLIDRGEPADPATNTPPPDFSSVDHCLAQPVEDFCSVDTLPAIQVVIVLINLLKLGCLLTILSRVKEEPLITLGDAITSFLSRPDPNMANRAPIDLLRAKRTRRDETPLPRWVLTNKRYWWFRGASPLRWTSTGIVCLSYLAIGCLFLATYGAQFDAAFNKYSASTAEQSVVHQFSGNSGQIDVTFSTTVTSIILANVFQLALSIAYFQYSGVITAMLLSREWTNFARYRKGLRVSSPQGSQRRTFWLSLPYAYNLPLLALASVLHWMMSETVFYQELNILDGSQVLQVDQFGEPAGNLILQARDGVFLDSASLSVLILFSACCILLVISLGFRSYPGGIPIVRSNSLALSHACHQHSNQPQDPCAPMAWGIGSQAPDGSVDVGLSSGNIELLDPSSLEFNRFERFVNRVKSNFHARAARTLSLKRWGPKRSLSQATETTIHQPLVVPKEKKDSVTLPIPEPFRQRSEHEWDYLSVPTGQSSGAHRL